MLFWRGLNIVYIASIAFLGFFIVQEMMVEPRWILNKAKQAGWTGTGDVPTMRVETPDKTVSYEITEQELYKLEKKVLFLENASLPITVLGGVIGYLLAMLIRKNSKHFKTTNR